jgi:hypothetical protein
MAYTVKYRGLSVTCEHPSDLDQLADRVERKPAHASSIGEVVSNVGESGQQFLKLLAERQSPTPKSFILRSMSLTEQQLPGIVTAISKPLKAGGFKISDVLSITGPNGKADERMYSLVPDVLDEVKSRLRL